VADHEVNPLWLGAAVAIDVEFVRGVVKQNRFRRGTLRDRRWWCGRARREQVLRKALGKVRAS
jgi:hypothetical protein